MDKSGRLVLPKKVRDEVGGRVFEVTVEKKSVVLRPRKGLAGLFGKTPGLGIAGFDRHRREEMAHENLP
ncbi:MAG: AbrB/MazE/SpoVT family DNA-binding domain-containing protein [Candidatus Micrarchaeota archaeon]